MSTFWIIVIVFFAICVIGMIYCYCTAVEIPADEEFLKDKDGNIVYDDDGKPIRY